MALLTDDQDLNSNSLALEVGGNGDYYIKMFFKDRGGSTRCEAVRVSTSGGNAPGEVMLAVAKLYREMDAAGLNEHPNEHRKEPSKSKYEVRKKIAKTDTGYLTVIDLPKDHKIIPFYDERKEGSFRHLDEKGDDVYYNMPSGHHEILGYIDDLTDDKISLLRGSDRSIALFYSTEGFIGKLVDQIFPLLNRYGKKPVRHVPFMGPGQYTQNDLDDVEEYNREFKAWQEAENEVCRNPFLILTTKG